MLSVLKGTGIFGKTEEEGQRLRDVSKCPDTKPLKLKA